jgi:hypothetical protein
MKNIKQYIIKDSNTTIQAFLSSFIIKNVLKCRTDYCCMITGFRNIVLSFYLFRVKKKEINKEIPNIYEKNFKKSFFFVSYFN